MKRIVCDASYDKVAGIAGIGIAWEDDDGVIAIDVVKAENSTVAEAMVVLRAVELISGMFHKNTRATFLTDCITIPRWLKGTSKGSAEQMRIIAKIKKVLEDRPRFQIKHVPRTQVRAAHVPAGQAAKVWVAGRTDNPTWSC